MLDFHENVILIDYLTFSSKIDSLTSLCEFLGLDFSLFDQLPYGLYGYQDRFYYNGITLLSGGHSDDMGVCCQMSGQGCRTFESSNSVTWFNLLYILSTNPDYYNVSRLDIAFDDHTGLLDMSTLLDSVDCQLYRSPSRSWTLEYGSEGSCIYIGSKKSSILIRIYDKARERGYDLDVLHWLRVEVQLRDDHAFNFLVSLFSSDDPHIGDTFLSVLKRYLVFVSPSNDCNKSRWPVSPWWSVFYDNVSSIRLTSSVGVEYNESNLVKYLSTQPAAAIKTYIRIYGLDSIVDLVDDVSLSPKYLHLLRSKGLIV